MKYYAKIVERNTVNTLCILSLETNDVIGTVSDEATWVAEGDQFEEDQLSECWIPEIKLIKIKGPCGHFH